MLPPNMATLTSSARAQYAEYEVERFKALRQLEGGPSQTKDLPQRNVRPRIPYTNAIFLNLNFYFNTAYAAHYVYFTIKIDIYWRSKL